MAHAVRRMYRSMRALMDVDRAIGKGKVKIEEEAGFAESDRFYVVHQVRRGDVVFQWSFTCVEREERVHDHTNMVFFKETSIDEDPRYLFDLDLDVKTGQWVIDFDRQVADASVEFGREGLLLASFLQSLPQDGRLQADQFRMLLTIVSDLLDKSLIVKNSQAVMN